MILRKNFANNLKAYRKAYGLTQEKLAELCDTDTSYIGQIETLKRFPSLTFVERIAEVLQIEPHLLLLPQEETEIKQKENPHIEIKNLPLKSEIKRQVIKMEKELKKLLETCDSLKNNIH